jgi:glycogen debranching enzyme
MDGHGYFMVQIKEMEDIIEEARARAVDVLRRCLTPVGFKASALPQGYPHIWARDAAIVSLGAYVSGEPDLLAAARASLETLSAHQSGLGLIPLNVDVASGTVSTENAGAVDANLWYILDHYNLFQATSDADFLRRHWPTLEQALLWLRYQDMNECGLLEVPEAGDWMDLMAVRYNTLYDNVLWYAALRAYSTMATAAGAHALRQCAVVCRPARLQYHGHRRRRRPHAGADPRGRRP